MDKSKSTGKTSEKVNKQKQQSLVSSLLDQISSGTKCYTYKALVEVRTKILKQNNGLSVLRQSGGARVLLDILEKPEEKWHDICLSILGNCCLDEQFRTEILQRDGVSMIRVLLQESKSPSVQNRACRSLANIAIDPHGCVEVHRTEGLLETIINILKESDDSECQQTFIRTIRLLADTESHRIAILDLRGLKTVADFLVSDTDAVSRASLKVIDHFINEQPTAQCALQLDLASVPKHIVAAVNNKSPGSIQYYNGLIHTMMKHECFRPSLGNSGAIQYFIERITDCELPIRQQYITINSLCLSCKESLNRVRIRDHAGLELLIKVLSEDSLHHIHNRVISAMLCFLYDEMSINIMLKNNVISVFMKHLALCPGWEVKESISSRFSVALERYIDEVVLVKSSLVTDDIEEVTVAENYLDSMSAGKDVTLTLEDDSCPEQAHRSAYDGFQECGNPEGSFKNSLASLNQCGSSEENNDARGDNVDVKCPRYSMDSPTYKEISQYVDDKTDNSPGPRSIYECQASSAIMDCWSSSSSSLRCSSPCSQSSYSPISNVSGYYSPDCSPKSSGSDRLPATPSFDFTDVPLDSPSHIYSPIQTAFYSSPSRNSSCSSLCGSKVGSHNSLVALQYSSSEDEADDKNDDVQRDHQSSSPHPVYSDPKKATISNILMFLSRVSFMENPSRYLLKWCILDGMIGFLMRNQHEKDEIWNRASRILIRIFQTPYLDVVVGNTVPLLIGLMSEECVSDWSKQRPLNETMPDKTSGKEASTSLSLDVGVKGCCETVGVHLLNILSMEAQNLYGRGVIIHALVTGPSIERVKTYLSLPFLYSDPEDLKTMMSYLAGGLDILAHLLGSKDDILLSGAVAFLRNIFQAFSKHSHMGHSEWHAKDLLPQKTGKKRKRYADEASIQSNQKMPKHSEVVDAVPDVQASVSSSEVLSLVKLMCSNKESIEVSRDVLSQASDVFSTMLSGSFCEAKNSSVVISDFNSATICLFVDYLRGKELSAMDTSIHDLQDLLRLADQYLIHALHIDVCKHLINWLDDCLVSPYNNTLGSESVRDIAALLRASLLHSCQWFAHMCLTKVLCSSYRTLSFGIQKELIKNIIELDNNIVTDIMLVVKRLLM